jgi:tetratricopeptide (TPR) repeat protein
MRRLILLSTLVFAIAAPSFAHGSHKHNHQNEDAPLGGTMSNSDYFLMKSDEAFHAGDYDRAILLHRARVAIDPEAVDSFGAAAWLLWSMGKGGEAIEFIERGLKTNPDNWEMWNEAGQHFDMQKVSKRSQASYQRALELLPEGEPSQMLRRRLAHAAEKAGDLPTSLKIWQGLAKDYPDQVVNQNNLRRVEKLSTEAQAQRTGKAAFGAVAAIGAGALALAVKSRVAKAESETA